MNELLGRVVSTGLATVWDVAPVVALVFGFHYLVLRRPIAEVGRVLAGFGLAFAGLTLFLVGLEQALFPLGRLMARQLAEPDSLLGHGGPVEGPVPWFAYAWVYLFGACLAFASAMAEPALMAVALKAREVSGGAVGYWGLRVAVASGAALGTALGTLRIVVGVPLPYLLTAGYVVVAVQTVFAPRVIVPLAYDSGGVTTSTVTVPLVTALGLGLASVIPDRSPLLDGFGMVAMTCLMPIVTVLAYAQIAAFRARRGPSVGTAREVS